MPPCCFTELKPLIYRFEMASHLAVKRLDEISDNFPVSVENPESLIETAMTTLGSKMFDTSVICISFMTDNFAV